MPGILTIITFLPLVGALAIAFVSSERLIRVMAISTIGLQLIFSIFLWISFEGSIMPDSLNEAFQFKERVPWINWDLTGLGTFRVDYHLGVDGISLPLVVLSSLILLIGLLSSIAIKEKVKGYHILYLVLGTSVMGCFVSLDFFLFYLFFEFMLLPMFFLIGIWGGKRREYASVKFFLYTLLGSLLVLIVMVGLFYSVEENGNSSFSLIAMLDSSAYISGSIFGPGHLSFFGISARAWGFWLLIIGFIIKLPSVPFHTWLPDAHVEAPTPISVILAGLLLKIGGYGLARMAFGFFPDQALYFAVAVGVLGMVSILFGGMTALAQDDLKRLVAYSSVSHMGFVLLGLAAITLSGWSGAVFHMVSHGLLSPALFLVVGVLYDRTQNREIQNFSGLASKMPLFTFMTGLFFFGSLGLPGLSGFVGELMVLMGAFGSDNLPMWLPFLSVFGILISAAYFLWVLQRMYLGKYWVRESSWEVKMVDLTAREWIMLLPLGILVIMLGLFPSLLLIPINNSLQFWVNHLSEWRS